MELDSKQSSGRRTAIVLSGGGARGAYEAGVLAYVFEHVYPQLGPGFEFDIVTGTSVGAIHAGYLAASASLDPKARASALSDTWSGMALDHVLRLNPTDLVGVPLRALGIGPMRRSGPKAGGQDVFGGLVDITPLEKLVGARIPWRFLRGNLEQRRPGALCVAGTAIDTGEVVVFLDGPLADPAPWDHDPYVRAVKTAITAQHVRASAAIPFLFPSVRIGDRFYVDGGLRLNTPLSPALRLRADRVLVVGLRRPRDPVARERVNLEGAITQPAFVLGKLLDILMLDQLEQELKRLDLINTLIEGAMDALGTGCLDRINAAIRDKRGVEYRKVDSAVIRPSQDVGAIAADAYRNRKSESRSRGVLAYLMARMALFGVPESEADLFSYLYFDASFTQPLLELGWEDARSQEEEIVRLLAGDD
jgi:NTE family protein